MPNGVEMIWQEDDCGNGEGSAGLLVLEGVGEEGAGEFAGENGASFVRDHGEEISGAGDEFPAEAFHRVTEWLVCANLRQFMLCRASRTRPDLRGSLRNFQPTIDTET